MAPPVEQEPSIEDHLSGVYGQAWSARYPVSVTQKAWWKKVSVVYKEQKFRPNFLFLESSKGSRATFLKKLKGIDGSKQERCFRGRAMSCLKERSLSPIRQETVGSVRCKRNTGWLRMVSWPWLKLFNDFVTKVKSEDVFESFFLVIVCIRLESKEREKSVCVHARVCVC